MYQKIFLVFALMTFTGCFALESRAKQNFGVNCRLNQYVNNEFDLAMRYLNATIYTARDTVALKGFSRMFRKFWRDQIDNVNKLLDYVVHRGGVIETPGSKAQFFNNLNSIDFFENETMMVFYFLEEERKLNRQLLDLHQLTGEKDPSSESECVKVYGGRRGNFYSTESQFDPVSANFLDENLTSRKVKQIKFLADLLRRVNRFDQHIINVPGSVHHLNPLGIHTLDLELLEMFS